MISFFVTLIVFLMLGVVVFQTVYVLGYQIFLGSDQPPKQSLESPTDNDGVANEIRSFSPPAAVILCLKGADESLADCLTGIISQDYPDFQLNIVIHSATDPAANIVEEFFSPLKFKPKIQYLESPQETCSLKCSAIVQAVKSLSDRIEVVALIDGDAVVDQNWLSDLVTPLGDPHIGATTGNRWYSPTDGRLGALVRKIWNAAAIVQMQRYDIAWGGSLAMRRDVIRRCELLSQWKKSFCEDTSLTNALRKQKLSLHRVANLVVENKEASSFWGTFDWISRQLLTVRLHHPAWPLVLLHGIVTGVASILAPLLTMWLFYEGMTGDAWRLLQMIVVYQGANFVLLYMIGRSNRRVINDRNSHNQPERSPEKNLAMHLCATLVTQIVQPLAIWQANSIEKVKWRGATYRVKNGRKVKLLKVDGKKTRPQPKASKVLETDQGLVQTIPQDAKQPDSHFSKRSRN